jgi:hypothetical protein
MAIRAARNMALLLHLVQPRMKIAHCFFLDQSSRL